MQRRFSKISSVLLTLGLAFAGVTQAGPATAAACDYSKPRSATQNGEVFLGGKYIELGISDLGDFGTVGDGPGCFVPRRGGNVGIGMVTDIDGFGQGEDIAMDYFLPGTPEERFGLGAVLDDSTSFGISQSRRMVGSDTTVPSTGDIKAEVDFVKGNTTVTNTSTGTVLSATIVTNYFRADGTTPLAKLTQNISFAVNDRYFLNNVTIKNESTNDWTETKYYRNFDPDNTVDLGGSFDTENEIISTIASDQRAVVRAQTTNVETYGSVVTRAPIMLYSADTDASAGYGGFSNSNVFSLPFDGSAKGDKTNNDIAIFMLFNKGALAAGSSVSLKYVTSLDSRYFYEINQELSLALDVPINLMVVDAKISDITATSARLAYNSTEAATGYVLVLPSSDPAPSAADVISLGSSSAIVRGANTKALSGLTEGVEYKAYVVAKQGTTTSSVLASEAFVANTPPAVSATSVSNITVNSADFNLTTSQDGNLSWVVQRATLPAPSVTAVRAGNSDSITTGANTISVSGLDPFVEYKIYYLAVNNFNNISPLGSSTFKTLPNVYTYTFSYDDAAVAARNPASATWRTGDVALRLPRPTRAGYTFSGWFSDAGLTNPISSPQTPTSNLDLYAKWTAGAPAGAVSTATVTFNANFGANPDKLFQSSSSPAQLTGNSFVRRGYSFAGWSTKADGSGDVFADKATYSFSADTILYASWKLNAFKQKVATFAAGDSTLTDAMKTSITAWAAELPDGALLKCTGFYSKSSATRVQDKKAALARATAVCELAKSLRPDITFSTSTFGSALKGSAARFVSAKLG